MTKIIKMNGEIVNQAFIEEYNTETEQWEPLNGKGSPEIHTTPYVCYEEHATALATGPNYTMPSDGMVIAKLLFNGLIEFECVITINIKDENGNKVDSAFGTYTLAALRPSFDSFNLGFVGEVKKGWTLNFQATGISGGRIATFWKLDPTYRKVDTNGNFIEIDEENNTYI